MNEKKLKPDRFITGLIPAIAAVSVFVLAMIFLGQPTGYKVLAGMIFIYSLFQYYAFYRVRSLTYFISATYILSLALCLFSLPIGEQGFDIKEFSTESKLLAFITVFLLLWLVYLLLSRRVKWKGREVFELAATRVAEAENGFTERPHPLGRVDCPRDELLAYARFLQRNHIALTFIEKDKIVLVPAMMGQVFSLLYTIKPKYHQKSRVIFTYDGDMLVQISRRDYLEYKDQLSFDRLCESMGNLFKEFLEMYRRGEGTRIIDRLDALKLSVFS